MNAANRPVLQVRGVSLGKGRPKIIVPLTDAHDATLLAAAHRVADSPADMVEWRADRYAGREQNSKVVAMAGRLREIIGERPLLFTVRTKHEGGDYDPTRDHYRDLIADCCAAGVVDLVDVQYLNPAAQRCLAAARAHKVPVVASNHDYARTPKAAEIATRLEAMDSFGADICKIAVMPRNAVDVANLLLATATRAETSRVPLITMALGPLGAVSRLSGQVFGSCATFATLGDAGSAPGQLPLPEVQAVLELLGRGL